MPGCHGTTPRLLGVSLAAVPVDGQRLENNDVERDPHEPPERIVIAASKPQLDDYIRGGSDESDPARRV